MPARISSSATAAAATVPQKPTRLAELGVRTLLVLAEPGVVGAQLRMGYDYGLREGYEGIITMDGNDKDGVDVIDRFIEKLDAGFDYVQGSRYMPGGRESNTPLSRRIAIRWIHTPILSLVLRFQVHRYDQRKPGIFAEAVARRAHPTLSFCFLLL